MFPTDATESVYISITTTSNMMYLYA